MKLRIGTRGSALALAQSTDVAARLRSLGHEPELVIVSTTGDRVTDRAFTDVGSFGVFVRELESALLDGTIDAAVHSYKDVPSRMPAGLTIAAVPERLDAADVLLVRRDAIAPESGGIPLAHGARVMSGRTDPEGLVVAELPRRSTRLVYVTPSHQFPSGVVMTLIRRLELLKWAARTGSWIFEDDYDTEFHAGGRSLPALRSLDLADRVLYVGTFSKTLFPSLRLGYIVCPKALRDDLYRAKRLDDLGCAAVEQAALATFIQSGQYERHLRKTVKEIINRRRTIVEALQSLVGSHVEIGPHQAGMHFVIWLRNFSFDRLDGLIDRAKSLGLGLHPVHPYYRTRPSRPGLLVGYAGLSVGQLRTAVALFARCLDSK